MSKNNIDICNIAPSIEDILKENQWLKIEIKELKTLNEHLNKYIDNFRQNANIQNLYDNQQIYKLKQAIKILKVYGEIRLFINRNNNNKLTLYFDDCISCVLEAKEYELLKQVFESVGDSDE